MYSKLILLAAVFATGAFAESKLSSTNDPQKASPSLYETIRQQNPLRLQLRKISPQEKQDLLDQAWQYKDLLMINRLTAATPRTKWHHHPVMEGVKIVPWILWQSKRFLFFIVAGGVLGYRLGKDDGHAGRSFFS